MEIDDQGTKPQSRPSLEEVQDELFEMESQLDHLVEEEANNLKFFEATGNASSASLSKRSLRKLSPNAIRLASSKKIGPRSRETERVREELGTKNLVISTLLSLTVVLVLLGAVRLALPQMLEWCRYSWTRGQLRAEYEMSGQQLRQVSMEGLTQVSQLIEKRVNPSVVHIDVQQLSREGELSNSKLRGLERMYDLDSLRIEQGSGVLIDSDGHLVTNHHVVEGEGKIQVLLHDGRVLPAKIVGVDPETDLALLKVEGTDLMPIQWGDSDEVNVGMPVWAVGSPFGLTGSVTFGILSGKHRIDLSSTRLQGSVKSQAEYSDLMQSDVAVNPGNSGGPLVNAQGELIGINTAIIGESFRGVSFSIPSNVVRRVCEKIISTGKMERGILGIMIDERYHPKRDGKGRVGLLVRDFSSEESPARKAGIVPGDIIVQVDGKAVEALQDLRRIVGESYVGDTIHVLVCRDSKEIPFEVRVAPNPYSMGR